MGVHDLSILKDRIHWGINDCFGNKSQTVPSPCHPDSNLAGKLHCCHLMLIFCLEISREKTRTKVFARENAYGRASGFQWGKTQNIQVNYLIQSKITIFMKP